MANNDMNHSLLKKFILTEIQSDEEQDFSYMIEGPHGIGKSAIVTEVCLEEDGFLIDLRLGQRDLGDILGMPVVLPVNDDLGKLLRNKFEHIKPELVRMAFVKDLSELGTMGDDKDVLAKYRDVTNVGKPYKFIAFFADEYNRGTKDVQQAMFELVYDRRMSGYKVHPKCWIFAACNDNMEIYTVTEGDPAFRSRFKKIKYTPTVDEWLIRGKKTGELSDELIFTISAQKALADPPKKKDNDLEFLNQPHPNRRSWHHASKFFVRNRTKFSETEMRDCMAAFVGGESAEIFRMSIHKMKDRQSKREENINTENSKANELYSNYIQFMRWDTGTAKAEVAKYNASELQALEALLTKLFGTYKYITKNAAGRIIELADVVIPKEVFARIWANVDDKYKFKAKLIKEADLKGKTNFFVQFDKLK
jgi:hypothetical protein